MKRERVEGFNISKFQFHLEFKKNKIIYLKKFFPNINKLTIVHKFSSIKLYKDFSEGFYLK